MDYTTAITKTVGVGGDFATLADAWEWASAQRFIGANGSLTIEMLAGDHFIDHEVYRHPDAGAITIKGQPRLYPVPTINDMTGVRATDKAFARSVYPTRLNVSGLHSYGIEFPDGICLLKDVFIESLARYTVAIGEFGPSTRTSSGRSIALDGVTIFGGVWGIMGLQAWITNRSQNAFLYQDIEESGGRAGGPFYLFGSQLRSIGDTSYRLDMYSPNSQYGMWLEDCYVYGDNTLHFARAGVGIHAFGSTVSAASAEFNRCRAVAFSQRGSDVSIWNSTIYACDARSGDSPMEFWQGYTGSYGMLIGVGVGSSVNLQEVNFDGSAAKYGVYATGSAKVVGFNIRFNQCAFSNALMVMEAADAYISYSVISPTVGTSSSVIATKGADVQTL